MVRLNRFCGNEGVFGLRCGLTVLAVLLQGVFSLQAETTVVGKPDDSLVRTAASALDRARVYLIDQQMEDGSWKKDPAITALVTYALLMDPVQNPNLKSEKALNAAFAYLEGFVKPDGGIYRAEYRNYVTAVCLLAFTESGRRDYGEIIANAKDFLIKYQIDESEGFDDSHVYYGGIGYGGDDRPDLSNTQIALEAIHAAEQFEKRYQMVLPDSESSLEREEAELGLHWKKALTFLARCQNLTEVNDQDYATDDGGFIYETGTYKPERSHSYGSMTYAGVKSLLYARLEKDDKRVAAAMQWIKDHYTLEENPGYGINSLYYYYMTFGKCLHVYGEDVLVSAGGDAHAWRRDLLEKLVSIQKPEGYWANTSGRYWENLPELATAYAIVGMKSALR